MRIDDWLAGQDHAKTLAAVYRDAAARSTDPSTQNGAMLVAPSAGGYDLISAAVNRFPAGVAETADRWQRPAKYAYVEHAERGAIYEAARLGSATDGSVLYACWVACPDCARAIVLAGVSAVVTHDAAMHRPRQDWVDQVRIGRSILAEAGVRLVLVPGRFEGVRIRFGGESVVPE